RHLTHQEYRKRHILAVFPFVTALLHIKLYPVRTVRLECFLLINYKNRVNMIRLPIGLAALCLSLSALAGEQFDDKFRQLDELLPTPTTIRTASGAPGHAYWQQRADYTIRASLDEARRAISGSETIT